MYKELISAEVSIIIPAYQAEKTIERCLESIIKQTYLGIEVIIVNDGSSDNTLKLCNQFAKKDNRIRVITQKKSGVSAARNKGLEKATGRYVAFFDSDDFVDINYILKMKSVLEENNSDLCICGYKQIVDKKHEKNVMSDMVGTYTIQENNKVLAYMFCENLLNPIWNKLYRRELIHNRFDENFSAGEDLLFNLEYIKEAQRISIIDESLYIYMVNKANGIRSLYQRIEFRSFKRYYEIIIDFFSTISNEDFLKIENKYINELMGCFLSLLVKNKLNPVETLKQYRIECEDKNIMEAADKLVHSNINNKWARLIYEKKYFVLLVVQYFKWIRNAIILKFSHIMGGV